MPDHKWNGSTNQRHFDQMLLGVFNTLLYGVRNLTRFAQPDANMARSISHHEQGAITEAASPFDHLRDAGDLDHSFFQV